MKRAADEQGKLEPVRIEQTGPDSQPFQAPLKFEVES